MNSSGCRQRLENTAYISASRACTAVYLHRFSFGVGVFLAGAAWRLTLAGRSATERKSMYVDTAAETKIIVLGIKQHELR